MNVVQISFFIDPQGRAPRQLLEDWWSLVDVAEAAARSGVNVSVVQASSRAEIVSVGDVTYYFVAPEAGARSITLGSAFAELVRSSRPDLCHVHGLGFPEEVLHLAKLLPRTPILLQDHANRVPRLWRRRKWRQSFAAAAGISFCASAQARPFQEAGLISPRTRIFEIPESTSRFQPGDQALARAVTGVYGDPAVLWVGHLNSNKDPLTVLAGLRKAMSKMPDLHVWCCYGSAPLQSRVQRMLDADAMLRDRVHLLGRVSHAHVEQLMRAADLFVLGSHREGSGYSLIEAMACGLPAAVTDIPSFRTLLGTDAAGALWQPGDADACARAVCELAVQRGPSLRARVRQTFQTRLALPALGQQLLSAYRQLACEPVYAPVERFA